ncbi:hypothetical protein [Pseudosulfitobacter pseudonitzschiae]|uniref:hypothetical protein n=1 Tax=Pseudosulfitobacter pseudonitzschiae TaxID=1402135 RepID=UPI001AF5D469|nr:hypothetical protein [Pseudosulfitobacter pseudonitzschiae]MBM1817157.1 hypothetical protein [Pseudosulfitobacter pseudonitzschiae]MBM1834160.1 hypothetical protein [Pseudosulfitobacter pseudonitzschiae]MBM1839025.1 hypothetical protein [Pseudosulfitobacter pseudonitzschiae]MBM1843875.1 hypothetical protein [Pseudosulfitobacter pseudonitzschiae]MBM1848721.1 hypothetical protein [Pseudosulfitobacter pseudonitzschiae]
MKNINPELFGTADLTTNVAITETEWTAGTHSLGDQRYVGKDLYEVVADPNTTDEPTAGAVAVPPTWVLVGQINRWRMFNGALHQPTTQTGGPITVTLSSAGIINAVAALKCIATEVTVTVTDATDGEVYSNTISLVDNENILDIYDYFFAPIVLKGEFALFDLPPYAGAEIEITLDAGTSDTECGALVLGQQAVLGETYLSFSVRDRFFSLRERNAFGDFLDVTSRPVAREATFDVSIESRSAAQVLRLIQDRRDVPTVFVGGEDEEHSIVFGFPDEPEVTQLSKELTRLNLTILGQT